MSAIGQFLHLRLFLEGVEVPVVAASIQSTKNAAARAAIQIPANDYALDFLPRTLVHLFAYDIYNGVPPADQVSIGAPGTRVTSREDGVDPELAGLFPPDRFQSTEDQEEIDLLNESYKLIFGGETIGFSFSKSPTSRSITIQCMDWSGYWDVAYQYQVSGMSLGGGGVRAAFTGASTSVFNDFFDGSGDIVSRLIAEGPRSYPALRNTLLGGVVRIIEAIGGVYYGQRAVRGVNDFFSLAEIRLHLTQMVGANPYSDRDERQLLSANGFDSLFRRSLAGLGRLVTIRQVLLALQRYIFHEIVPITSPRYIPPLRDPNVPELQELTLEQDEQTRPLYQAAGRIRQRAEELKQRQSRVTDADSSLEESTVRGELRDELAQLSRTCSLMGRRAVAIGRQFGTSGGGLADFSGIPSVSQRFVVASEKFVNMSAAMRVRGTLRRFQFAGTQTAALVERALDDVIDAMTEIQNTRVRRRVQRRTQQPDPPPRLLTQIYRPDVWMVAPPRCNVIFPELYSSFGFSRDFNQETTRLLLRTHSAFYGSDELIDGFYMAPLNIMGARSGLPVTRGRPDLGGDAVSDQPLHIRRDILDHELYTGILPAFERMSDLNLHALRGGFFEIDTGSGAVRVGYAQLACNHIFFQKRFQTRSLMLQGRFNPYVVLGFPMLVIDRYMPHDVLREASYDEALVSRLRAALADGDGIQSNPTTEEQKRVVEANYARINEIISDVLTARVNPHFLGTPEMIVHSLSAESGGTTEIQMSYARTTNERTEFLGDSVGTRARHTRNQRVTTTVAATEVPVVGSTGYRGGKIVQVTDVTDEFTRSTRRSRTPRPALRGTSTTTLPEGDVASARQLRGGALPQGSRYSSSRTAPLYVANAGFYGRARRGTRVVVGVEQPAQSYGPEVVALVGAGGAFDSSTIDRQSWGDGTSRTTEVLVSFRAYRMVEEIGVYTRSQVPMPPEILTFPPWYGDSWRTNQIGGLYAYFFGTGAITDPLVVRDGRANSSRADLSSTQPDADAEDRSLSISLTQKIGDAETPGGFTDPDAGPPPGSETATTFGSGEVAGPAREAPTPADQQLDSELGSVSSRSPIGQATEELVRIYSLVKLNKYDVHAFIKAYTWRPIASMVDLFGTANLEINDQGEVTRGVEGFHSRAYGDFDDLRQLIGPGDSTRPQTILGLTVDDPDETGDDERASRSGAIAARLDTRKEKRTVVLRYVFSLGASCGVLG